MLLVGLRGGVGGGRNTSAVRACYQGRDLIPCSPQYDLETLTLFFNLRLYCYRYKFLAESRFQVFVEVTVDNTVTV